MPPHGSLSHQPYLVITADSHAGAAPELYGPYLEQKWQSDYQGWLKQAEQLAQIMRDVMGNRSIGVDGDPDEVGWRNWDSGRRLAECEREGVVGEIVFPNTSPPFAPSMLSEFGEADLGSDYERRWAGIRAHNRWLADFCAEQPHRRAGIAQIFLPFVEESVKEIRWAHAHGLRGGILLPGAPPGSGIEPLYAPCYEPIWETCAELGMPINHHSGGGTPEFGAAPVAMRMPVMMWHASRKPLSACIVCTALFCVASCSKPSASLTSVMDCQCNPSSCTPSAGDSESLTRLCKARTHRERGEPCTHATHTDTGGGTHASATRMRRTDTPVRGRGARAGKRRVRVRAGAREQKRCVSPSAHLRREQELARVRHAAQAVELERRAVRVARGGERRAEEQQCAERAHRRSHWGSAR